MGKPRNPEAQTTNRQMYWSDVDLISKYKKKVVRWGTEQNEADRDILHRIIEFYVKHNEPENQTPVSTYVTKEEAIQVIPD